MKYPFITLHVEYILGGAAFFAGLLLLQIDHHREGRRGRISPILRNLRPRTALRDLGLTFATSGAVLALPAISIAAAVAMLLADDVPRDDVRHHFGPLHDVLDHVTFGVFAVFVLSVLACLVRVAKRRTARAKHATQAGSAAGSWGTS